jgi:hypothetical protein
MGHLPAAAHSPRDGSGVPRAAPTQATVRTDRPGPHGALHGPHSPMANENAGTTSTAPLCVHTSNTGRAAAAAAAVAAVAAVASRPRMRSRRRAPGTGVNAAGMDHDTGGGTGGREATPGGGQLGMGDGGRGQQGVH